MATARTAAGRKRARAGVGADSDGSLPDGGGGGRGRITPAARRLGAQAKAQRGLFNRYVRALQGKAHERLQDQLSEVEATLERGTRIKKAPVFKGGKRVGTVEKLLPLLPSEHAKLLVRREGLRQELAAVVSPELRQAFLEMLPAYAAHNGFTWQILLEVGVPEADLRAAGIEPTAPNDVEPSAPAG